MVVEVRSAPSGGLAEEDAPPSNVVSDDSGGAPIDEGAPVGPSEGEESAFLAEQREQGFHSPASKAAVATEEPEEKGALPPLDDLVNRIPAATRELMDELFRAKFVTVKRVPKSALKNN